MSAWPLGGESISWRHRARSTEIDSVNRKESASGKRSLNITTLFVGGGIFAAMLVGPASAQTMRVTDDWITLDLSEGAFPSSCHQIGGKTRPEAQTRSS